MNHSFFPSQLNPALCKTCSRKILDHSKAAQCEACPNVGECDMFGTILMCKSCLAKEYKTATDASEARLNNPKVMAKVEADIKKDYNQRIESYTGYFNARITPIVELRELYDIQGKTLAEFHESIRTQIEQFASVLFQQEVQTTEDTVSKLLIEFRAEVRTKLKEGDINYTPPIKAPKVRTDRVNTSGKAKSPLDKMVELLIASEARKGNIMTVMEATRKLQREMGMTK